MFRASMVWGVYPELGEIQRVRQHLDVLSDLELTPLDIPDPELIYLFKHIITQQVAYESLLFATRAVLHNEIGKYIERVHGDALDEYVDLLAFHYEHSENDEKKRFYLRRAGDAARANYANSAAISYYSKAIPLLGDDDLVDVRLALGKVYDLIGEWDEAEAQYTAALALAQARANLSEQGWCATALGELHRKQAKYDSADSWLTQARAQFEQAGDLVGVGQALHYAGTLAAQQGTFPRAKALYGQSLAIREQLNDQRNIANLQSNLAIVARFEGDADGALSYNEQSLALREALGEPWAIAVSLNNLGNLHLQQANLPAAREHFENALVIWREIGERWATANTLHNLANVARDEGDFAAARTQFEESVAIWQALGDSWALAYWLEDTARYKALQDEASAAVRLAANADRLRGTAGIPLAPADAERLAVALAPARAAFDEATLSAETAAGAAMTLADAVALALS
jgi:predicted ATPase